MDACEATKIVMSRVQILDPENASKIMGYILIQDDGDKEMIRLAFGPEGLLLSCVNQVKARLGLPSNTSSPKPSTPLSNPVMPNTPFPGGVMIPNSPRRISYAAVLNGSNAGEHENSNNANNGSLTLQFHGDQLSFFDDSMVDRLISPSGRSASLVFPYGEDAHGVPCPHPQPLHRRSCSVNDAVFLSNLEESVGGNAFGRRPCMYFARGSCKNGSSCKFLHGDNGRHEMIEPGSSTAINSDLEEFLRMEAIQKQRFAATALRSYHSFPYNKSVNILNDNQRCGPRNVFPQMRWGAGLNSSSRKIYLTFPADSTFKEEDVSSYFSKFGPVEDVRIPYQSKRMFGFVTFVYPETVKLILAKGNPHYVRESRVLVKPYKEKWKIPEKKQFQQHHEHLEMKEYSACLSPSLVDSRELVDVPIGSRMLLNTEEMMLGGKLELEAEMQHAVELQSRRMTDLQLLELENPQDNHCFLPDLFTGYPRQQLLLMSENFMAFPRITNRDVFHADDARLFSSSKDQHVSDDGSCQPESLEHILPDNLYASPTKLAAEQQQPVFSAEAENVIPVTDKVANDSPVVASSFSPLRMSSLF